MGRKDLEAMNILKSFKDIDWKEREKERERIMRGGCRIEGKGVVLLLRKSGESCASVRLRPRNQGKGRAKA